MSAGFKVAGDVFWGTNGAVEAYVDKMAVIAASRFGPDDPLAAYLTEQRDSFSAGRVLYLDQWLADAAGRGQFLVLLDATTEQLLQEGTFTEYGREWMASVVAALRARVAGGGHSSREESAMPSKKDRHFRASAPFVYEGKKQFVAVEDARETVRRRLWDTKAILDEVVCPVTGCGCAIEEIAASPSSAWIVTNRLSGQGEWGYDVFQTCPLARVAGTPEEKGYMLDVPRFSPDDTRIVGGFGRKWLGGWWAHDDDEFTDPARGGLISFGFLLVHHLPSHRVRRHELQMDLPKGWLPDDPEAEMWHGVARSRPA